MLASGPGEPAVEERALVRRRVQRDADLRHQRDPHERPRAARRHGQEQHQRGQHRQTDADGDRAHSPPFYRGNSGANNRAARTRLQVAAPPRFARERLSHVVTAAARTSSGPLNSLCETTGLQRHRARPQRAARQHDDAPAAEARERPAHRAVERARAPRASAARRRAGWCTTVPAGQRRSSVATSACSNVSASSTPAAEALRRAAVSGSAETSAQTMGGSGVVRRDDRGLLGLGAHAAPVGARPRARRAPASARSRSGGAARARSRAPPARARSPACPSPPSGRRTARSGRDAAQRQHGGRQRLLQRRLGHRDAVAAPVQRLARQVQEQRRRARPRCAGRCRRRDAWCRRRAARPARRAARRRRRP